MGTVVCPKQLRVPGAALLCVPAGRDPALGDGIASSPWLPAQPQMCAVEALGCLHPHVPALQAAGASAMGHFSEPEMVLGGWERDLPLPCVPHSVKHLIFSAFPLHKI